MKKLSILILALAFASAIDAQVAQVDYMKVPAGGGDAYLAVEKQWKALHQNLVNEGRLIAWEFFAVIGAGTDSPYNFITVSIYKDLPAAMVGFTMDDVKKVWGEKYPDVFKKTMAARNLTRSELFTNAMGVESKGTQKYLMVSFMKATDDVDRYYKMEEKGYKPLHQEAVNSGKLTGWSVWYRNFPEDQKFDAAAINWFASADQMANLNYGELFNKVKANLNAGDLLEMTELLNNTSKIRSSVKTQVWELLDSTTAKK